MRLSEFDFHLPEGLVATRPARPRSSARLLVVRGDAVEDRRVRDLPDLLRPGDRLVLNDTRVIPARLSGTRSRPGAPGEGMSRIEVTLLAAQADGTWEALARPLRRLRPGDRVVFAPAFAATVAAAGQGRVRLAFDLAGAEFEAALEAAGAMPLPPYIERLRRADAADREDYQTVWARRPGAVAAPTASLHFDAPLLAALADRGVGFTHVTLHVGAGTFLPVTAEDIAAHRMHAEWGEITPEAAAEINAARAAGGRIIPVGTTALRLLESAADADGRVHPFQAETDIFITPGWRFRATDALITNFHLPKSTLIMLVAALIGLERTRAIYAHAVASGYRFFSYGDASLLFPAAADGARPVAAGQPGRAAAG